MLLAVVAVAGFLIHLPYVIISPGSATPLDSSVVQIDGAETYPHDESVLFLTVRVSTHDPNVWRVVTSWLDPDRAVEARDDVVGCLSDEQNVAFNTELMDQSQNDAKYVALDAPRVHGAGRPRADPRRRGRAASRRRTASSRPATRSSPSTAPTSATRRRSVELVQAHRPGDDVRVTYDRNGTTSTANGGGREGVEGPASPASTPKGSTDGHDRASGISSQEFTTYQFPINVKIDTQLVGGPSAGLAFTLAIIDDLTPGSLTGGKQVAVTGDHRARRHGRSGGRRRAEGDHRADERCAAHARAREGGQGRSARSAATCASWA